MNATKNIKMPQYAAEMGNGLFVGKQYIYSCRNCGLVINKGDDFNPPSLVGCPKASHHDWLQTIA